MNLPTLIALGLAAFIIYRIALAFVPKKELLCRKCGHIGAPKSAVKGNFLIEIILWLCFIIPGIIYSIWRASSRHATCQSCGSTELIATDSPMAHQMRAERSAINETRPCPECGEKILKEAKKCKHCGSAVTPKLFT